MYLELYVLNTNQLIYKLSNGNIFSRYLVMPQYFFKYSVPWYGIYPYTKGCHRATTAVVVTMIYIV